MLLIARYISLASRILLFLLCYTQVFFFPQRKKMSKHCKSCYHPFWMLVINDINRIKINACIIQVVIAIWTYFRATWNNVLYSIQISITNSSVINHPFMERKKNFGTSCLCLTYCRTTKLNSCSVTMCLITVSGPEKWSTDSNFWEYCKCTHNTNTSLWCPAESPWSK